MADFRGAFEKGLEAYADAERSRREINGVLEDFAAQISEASRGRISILRGPPKPSIAEVRESIERFRESIERPLPTSLDAPSIREKALQYQRLFAKSSAGSELELCAYKLDRHGYPVTLTFGSSDHICHDKASLEAELAMLLQDPETGAKLRALLGSDGSGPTESAA